MNVQEIDCELKKNNAAAELRTQRSTPYEEMGQAIVFAKAVHKEALDKEKLLVKRLTGLYAQAAKISRGKGLDPNSSQNKAQNTSHINTATNQLEIARRHLIIPINDIVSVLELEQSQLETPAKIKAKRSIYNQEDLEACRKIRVAMDRTKSPTPSLFMNVFLTQKIHKSKRELYEQMVA